MNSSSRLFGSAQASRGPTTRQAQSSTASPNCKRFNVRQDPMLSTRSPPLPTLSAPMRGECLLSATAQRGDAQEAALAFVQAAQAGD